MTDMSFWKDEQEFRNRQKQKERVVENDTKYRVKKKAKISVETCAIGSLSDFENAFGFLWKHGKDLEKLTPDEKKLRERWLEVRNSILDRAENSKKLLLREIDRCEFKNYKENKYTTILRPKQGEDYGRG